MSAKKEQNDNIKNKTKILIVDDHAIVRHGLVQLINQEPDLVVCAKAENADQALEAIKREQFDLAIVDITLNATTGIQLTERIKLKCPNLPVVLLSMHDESLYVRRAFRAGAKGYVAKNEAAEKIVTAIREVLSGKTYLSEKMAAKITSLGVFR